MRDGTAAPLQTICLHLVASRAAGLRGLTREESSKLKHIINEVIDPRTKWILTLYYGHNASMKVIAAIMKLTRQRVWQIIREGRAQLRSVRHPQPPPPYQRIDFTTQQLLQTSLGPTTAPPGSEEKIRVMAARLAQRLPLFHPRDCTSHEGTATAPVSPEDTPPDVLLFSTDTTYAP